VTTVQFIEHQNLPYPWAVAPKRIWKWGGLVCCSCAYGAPRTKPFVPHGVAPLSLSHPPKRSVLDKSNCRNYSLPKLRSAGFKGRLRHPPVFKLPRVRTTRSSRLLLTMLLITMSDLASFW